MRDPEIGLESMSFRFDHCVLQQICAGSPIPGPERPEDRASTPEFWGFLDNPSNRNKFRPKGHANRIRGLLYLRRYREYGRSSSGCGLAWIRYSVMLSWLFCESRTGIPREVLPSFKGFLQRSCRVYVGWLTV